MIDLEKVISQVKQGNYPSHWHVYHGYGNVGCLTLCWLFTFVVSFIAVMFGIGGILLVVLPCVGFCIVLTVMVHSNEKSLLIILPTGAVQCYGDGVRNASWIYFPGINRMEIAQQTEIGSYFGEDIQSKTYYWLDVYSVDGTYFKWGIRNCFGDTASICKTIIATYNLYENYNKLIF